MVHVIVPITWVHDQGYNTNVLFKFRRQNEWKYCISNGVVLVENCCKATGAYYGGCF